MSEEEAYIVLNMVPKLGPVRVRNLLAAFGSPAGVLRASAPDLQRVDGVGPEVASSIRDWEKRVDLAEELRLVAEFGARVVTLGSPDYPRLLRDIHDPPTVLYIWGTLEERDRHSIGVVGTRKPTHYAAECAKKISYQLAYAGITVVSGLARGVDTAAHQGALAAKGRTIAVIGSGLMAIYPPENIPLAERIAGSGAVVSEFPMRTTADRQTFPMRNRIISGASFGLLVVEAGGRSGALISANQAADQGRAIYAVPGRIDQPNAIGSNRLIQQGAKLITGAGDILDDMGLLFAESPELAPQGGPDLEGDEAIVFSAMGDDEGLMDEIVSRCGLPTPVVSSTLLALEMKKLVRRLAGSRFVKIR
ncbi:MAG: DNA-processing protein DprA [Terrimicrobiaceae bacterium]